MALERKNVVVFGPDPVLDEGLGYLVRNKVLQPCGCWSGEVWREGRAAVQSDDFVLGVSGHALPATDAAWHLQAVACDIHSAEAAVLQLQLAQRVNGAASLAQIGDGAKRLLADASNVLAKAAALDAELVELGCKPVSMGRAIRGAAAAAGVKELGSGDLSHMLPAGKRQK